MLVEPDAGKATWVAASTYGTDTTTGEEVKGARESLHACSNGNNVAQTINWRTTYSSFPATINRLDGGG